MYVVASDFERQRLRRYDGECRYFRENQSVDLLLLVGVRFFAVTNLGQTPPAN